MKIRHLIAFAFFILFQSSVFAVIRGVIINEFVASNKTGIKDEDNEFSDWIEIYNTYNIPINLSGCSLSDDASNSQKWIFPDVTIQANSYLLVYASEKDRKNPGANLHTNFKLSADGEYLAIFSPDEVELTVFNPFPPQEDDLSYGKYNSDWMVFNTPTPLAFNDKSGIGKYPNPIFSKNHGIYENAFTLSITCSIPDALIYYTTDGSTPSITNATKYISAISITGNKIIRAIATKPDNSINIRDSKIITRSYLFPKDIVKQPNNPVGYPEMWGKYCQISGTSIADYEMDPVLMAEMETKENVINSFNELPIISLVTDKGNLFNTVADEKTGGIYIFTGTPVGDGTGKDWERPASFEYFFKNEYISLQEDCGLQLHGGHSRLPEKCPKHSFRLDFSSDYGVTSLQYPLFGKNEASQVNSFFIRAGFGNTWLHQDNSQRARGVYSRDEWSKKTQKKMGNLTGNTQYAHLFLNGLYWGLYNPMERIDDDFCVTYLGGKKSDYDVIKVDDEGHNIFASDGYIDSWNELISLVSGAEDPVVYQKLQGNNPDGSKNSSYKSLIDLDNFIDYMLINFYGGNSDWDHHNWIALRNRVEPDKGFIFLCWDTELILMGVNDNLVREKNPENPSCPRYIFQQLKKNPLFKIRVGDRVQKHCFEKGSLSPTGASLTWLKLADVIETSLYSESARWGDYRKDVHKYTSAGSLYRKDVQFEAQKNELLNNYFPGRTGVFLAQLKEASLFPSVIAPVFKINGLSINNDTIENDSKLSITATSGTIYYTTDGSDPVAWNVNGTGSAAANAKLYSGLVSLNSNTTITSRAYSQSKWSALTEKTFFIRGLTGIEENTNLISDISIKCFPNPFISDITINFNLQENSYVEMQLFDLSGRKVASLVNENLDPGLHSVVFDGSKLSDGIYVGKMNVKGKNFKQKMFKISKL